LVSRTLEGVYDGLHDHLGVSELREEMIGRVRGAMARVFDDLLHKNLSGGEKAAFDLLLDFIIKRDFYDDTVHCIDEPELHVGSRVQGRLLPFDKSPRHCCSGMRES
jgi:hypothetical protein